MGNMAPAGTLMGPTSKFDESWNVHPAHGRKARDI